MANNRSNERFESAHNDNDSFGKQSRSGRGGSWSNRDDDDIQGGRGSRYGSSGSAYDSELHNRMEQGGSHTSAYGDEHSQASDRYRDDARSMSNTGRNRNFENDRNMSSRNSSNADMGADSWGGSSDRDTGRDSYNDDDRYSTGGSYNSRDQDRSDYYGNRSSRNDSDRGGRNMQSHQSDYGFGGSRGGYGSSDRDYSSQQRNESRDAYGSGSGNRGGYGGSQGNYMGQSSNRGQSNSDRFNRDSYGESGSRGGSRGASDYQRDFGSNYDRDSMRSQSAYGDSNRDRGYGAEDNQYSGRGTTGGRDSGGYSDRYSGREGGSNQFSSWRNDPSDMRSSTQGGGGYQGGMQGYQSGQQGMQRGQHAGRGPKGYRRDDNRITEDVNEALTHDGHLDASEIEVKVSNGEVTLTGTVDSREAKRHAEDIAERVSGVSEVTNQLKVSKNTSGWNSSTRNASSQADGEGERGSAGSSASSSGDQQSDKNKTASKSGASTSTSNADGAMSSQGSGPSGAASTSTATQNPSGKTSPNTSGASTLKMGDKGAQS